MPTDLNGTPTSLGIGTYNVDVDAPSGLGFNAAMAQIDALLKDLGISGLAAHDVPVYDTVSGKFIAATGGDGSGAHFLADDGTFKSVAGSLSLIDDYTVSGATLASYDTNTRLSGNIPQTYKDLILVIRGNIDIAGPQNAVLQMNGRTTANYYSEILLGGAATPVSAESLAATSINTGAVGGSAGAGFVHELLFPNYTSPTFKPSVMSEWGENYDTTTGKTRTGRTTGFCNAANEALTRIVIGLTASAHFVIGTRFTLYGRS